MTIKLANLSLDDDLRLDGLDNAPDAAIQPYSTIGGGSGAQVLLTGDTGRNLALVASMDGEDLKGLFLRSEIEALKTIAAAGNPVPLEHHRGNFTVLITGFAVESVRDRVDPESDEWLHGTIQLYEV